MPPMHLQLETAYGKLDDLREEHEEAVHGLQFQLSQQHKVSTCS
jgi:hypothetical protein